MALMTTGNGATLVFTTSSTFTPAVVSIDGLEETLAALQDSTLATLGHHTMIPADLIEIAPFTVAIRWDNDAAQIPPLGVAEIITLTYPTLSGESTPADLAGTGFITSRTTPSLANDEISEGSITIQFDGKTAPAFTAAT